VGTVFKKNGSWYINYMYQGRRIRKKVGRSKKIDELALKDVELKIARDEFKLADKNVKIEKVLNEFSNYLKSHKSPKTAEKYIEILIFFKTFLEENYPNIYLNQIKEKHIEDYKSNQLEKIKPTTVNFDLRVLNIFLIML